MNIRLDFISEFENPILVCEEMRMIRCQFMLIDEALRSEFQHANDNPAMARSLANARTHVEEACQHAIKALCLKHEKRIT